MTTYVDQLKKDLSDVEEQLFAVKQGKLGTHAVGPGGRLKSTADQSELERRQKELRQTIIDAEAMGN